MALFLSLWIKLSFILGPFFALTIFLTLTEGYDEPQRRKLVWAVSAAVAVLCLLLFFTGKQIFSLFGITLNSFRVGAGVLLLLSGIALVYGKSTVAGISRDGDVAVVPLAMPIIVGPATIGTLLVLGAELSSPWEKAVGCLALFSAIFCLTAVLMAASTIQRCLGGKGVSVLNKLNGLILAALAAQMIMTGIQGFFYGTP